MRIKQFPLTTLAVGLAWLAVSAPAQEAEIHVGRSAAGQLKVDVHFAQPLKLETSVFPNIAGFATGLMGVHSEELSEPDNDFYSLATTAELRLVLLAKDTGMEIWNDSGTGFMAVGQTFYVGQPPFDTHPIWNLLPSAEFARKNLTLKLQDMNGVYTDSEPFVLSFTSETTPQLAISHSVAPLPTVNLSWPTNTTGWVLEATSELPGENWTTVTNNPVVNGSRFGLTLPAEEGQQFFRLRQL